MNPLKILLSLGTAVTVGKLAHMASTARWDDVLGSVGLAPRRSHFFQGVLLVGAGAALGAGVALLLAPASGQKTRARLGKEFSKLSDAATEAVRETTESARSLVHATNDTPTSAKSHS
ncbi:MAG TPA: YtxH domain-containing protein [Polyangiaceae bacterium]|nr:YtxH domain-containing protein [Polyangiaceae bacterium]